MKTEFDIMSQNFTESMMLVSGWKQNYFGAAYSTRLKQAIQDARLVCVELEAWMKENNEW